MQCTTRRFELEFKAGYLTRRAPSGTVEGICVARRAMALSIDKARHEFGYAPRPIKPVLEETIARMIGVPAR
jgi:dihydroflavonol-4-reductase